MDKLRTHCSVCGVLLAGYCLLAGQIVCAQGTAIASVSGGVAANAVTEQTVIGSICWVRVMDSEAGVLRGARLTLQPGNVFVSTDDHGAFTFGRLPPGSYVISVFYTGFSPFSSRVTRVAGATIAFDAVLSVEMKSEHVVVRADSANADAEVEAIERQRTAANILLAVPVR